MTTDFVLLLVAAVVAAYLLLLLALSLIEPVSNAMRACGRGLMAPFVERSAGASQRERFRELEREVERALGASDEWGTLERAEIVEAALASQQIAILNQLLRHGARQCLQMHWSVASGLGALEMREAARHPMSQRLRQRVLDLSELLAQRLEHYPLLPDAPELVRLQLGIRWIPPTCIACPYWTMTVAEAPRICPTAKALGQDQPRSHSSHVIDGEVVGDGDD